MHIYMNIKIFIYPRTHPPQNTCITNRTYLPPRVEIWKSSRKIRQSRVVMSANFLSGKNAQKSAL